MVHRMNGLRTDRYRIQGLYRPDGANNVMARTRRRKRTSTQRIAGLVALGLPAPMQRVADTRLGSLMLLIFIPAMVISGVLTFDWKTGSINVDRNKAQQLKQKAANEITQWSQDGTLQNWQANVERAWHQAQENLPQSQNATSQGSWQPQHPAWQQRNENTFPSTRPSTSPGGFVSHSQPQQQPQQQPQTSWGQWNTQPQQPFQNNQPANNNPNGFGQQFFNQQGFNQQGSQPNNAWPSGNNNQQPFYGNPGFNQGANQSNPGSPSGNWLR